VGAVITHPRRKWRRPRERRRNGDDGREVRWRSPKRRRMTARSVRWPPITVMASSTSARCGRGHGEHRRGAGVHAWQWRGSTGARRDYGEGGKGAIARGDGAAAVRVYVAARRTEEGACTGGCQMRRGKEADLGGQTEESGHMQLPKTEMGPTRQTEKRENHFAFPISTGHTGVHHLMLLLGVWCRTERSKDALDATGHVQCQQTGRNSESSAFIVRHLVLTRRVGAMLQVIHRTHLEQCSSLGVHSTLVPSSSTDQTRW
jgi:hypothetical protein